MQRLARSETTHSQLHSASERQQGSVRIAGATAASTLAARSSTNSHTGCQVFVSLLDSEWQRHGGAKSEQQGNRTTKRHFYTCSQLAFCSKYGRTLAHLMSHRQEITIHVDRGSCYRVHCECAVCYMYVHATYNILSVSNSIYLLSAPIAYVCYIRVYGKNIAKLTKQPKKVSPSTF